MCGIFGLIVSEAKRVSRSDAEKIVASMLRLSESRGKEAAGLAIRFRGRVLVYKQPIPATEMLRTDEYRDFWKEVWGSEGTTVDGQLTVIGHSRLVTNGLQGLAKNNQPVIKSGVVGIHNGIIVNDAALWERFPTLVRESEVDTEVVMSMVRHFLDAGRSVPEAFVQIFEEIYGAASLAVLFEDRAELVLATNTGSLYFAAGASGDSYAFTSEKYIMGQLLEDPVTKQMLGAAPVTHIRPMQAKILDLNDMTVRDFSLDKAAVPAPVPAKRVPAVRTPIIDTNSDNDAAINALRRCVRCILPETFPFLNFDSEGVCNFCRNHVPTPPKGRQALVDLLAPYRSKNGEPDCIVAFSGGRDSTYSLHYIKAELGMTPLAYTYDWGMVTDLARRNQARICGKLGIEQILISADIRRKRNNIRKNIEAWLKRPRLGMIPLFMAGDKQYFYFAHELRRQTGIKPVFFAPNNYEKTGFKTGFCGLDFSNKFFFSMSILPKAQLAGYYLKQYMLNPSYFNTSLVDTMFSFYSSFFLSHDYTMFYDYIPWDEKGMMDTLKSEYDWEMATDTKTSWRIGDGTAAFYNFIYYTVAGFTEHDTFLSNQIRDGVMDRAKAIEIARTNNQARYETIREYSHQIGFDADHALHVINSMPKLYGRQERSLISAAPYFKGQPELSSKLR